MAGASRWSLSARQGFLACGLVTVGLFVLPCGAAMGSVPIAALGVAVGLLGPIVIVLSGVRANRPDVVGTAHVSQSSAPPTTGVSGPANLHLVVNAQGVHNAVVRIRDANVPLSKWPDVGSTLPVLIPNGNPRRLQVLWDRVGEHRDLVMDDVQYSSYVEPDDYPGGGYVEENPVDEPLAEPLIEQTAVLEPVSVVSAPPASDAAASDATASDAAATPMGSAVGVRRRPSPRPRREPASPESVEAVVPVTTTVPWPTTPDQRSPNLPRRVPGATRANGAASPAPEDRPGPAAQPERVVPDLHVAPYLTNDAADAPEGLGEVHNVGVTLIVSDLQRSLTFYRDVLGLTLIDGGTGSAILASGDSRILLRQVEDAQPVDHSVVDLNLEVDDVHEAYERLRRQGVEFTHQPHAVDLGEQLEHWTATLRDPDGHVIALAHWEAR